MEKTPGRCCLEEEAVLARFVGFGESFGRIDPLFVNTGTFVSLRFCSLKASQIEYFLDCFPRSVGRSTARSREVTVLASEPKTDWTSEG
jgi:hypothetical protein